MKPIQATALMFTLGAVACGHAPTPYSFTATQAANDIDVVVRTLQANGLKPAQIDRQLGTVTTLWFDTGYQFRESDEFRDGAYPGAKNIPLADLGRRLGEIPKDRPVVLYCASGARSSSAARAMKQAGYSDVINAGGLADMPS